MGNFLKTQNVFSDGEVSPEFYAINNVHGLSKLENMDVLPSGGLKRRAGLRAIGNVPRNSVLIPFIISESEKYLLAIYDRNIDVYSDDVKIASIVAPWHNIDLKQIQYAQRFNNLFITHPSLRPQIFTKDANGFAIKGFYFYMNEDISINIPFMRFDDMEDIGITISASTIDNNHATFTASSAIWTSDWVGERLLVNNKQWIIDSVQDSYVAIVHTNGDFSLSATPIREWYVAAFGDKRGWPMAVSFHQNRLVFGGTKSAPNSIWLSRVGDYNNFAVGEGLDDESISISLLSAQHNQISTIVSSDNLQIFTSVGEWAVSNKPLTPSNVDIKQHTSVGSMTGIYLPPQQIENATVFVSKSGKDIRKLDLDTLGQNYLANDLSVYAKHMFNNPTSLAYNQLTHQLFVVMSDGCMAVLNKHVNTDINAWAKYITDGSFKYVVVMDNATYVIVERQNRGCLEKFDETCMADATDYTFSYNASAFPIIVSGHNPKKMRARKVSLRVQDTKTLFVNNHRLEIPNDSYDINSDGYSGDLSINLLGYQFKTMEPLWSISSSEQLPATILSVTIDGWYLI